MNSGIRKHTACFSKVYEFDGNCVLTGRNLTYVYIREKRKVDIYYLHENIFLRFASPSERGQRKHYVPFAHSRDGCIYVMYSCILLVHTRVSSGLEKSGIFFLIR